MTACGECGAPVPRGRRALCSDRCAVERRLRASRERRRIPPPTRACAWCGGAYTRHRGIYCGRECHAAAYAAERREARAARRAELRAQSVAPELTLAGLAISQPAPTTRPCARCGKPIRGRERMDRRTKHCSSRCCQQASKARWKERHG